MKLREVAHPPGRWGAAGSTCAGSRWLTGKGGEAREVVLGPTLSGYVGALRAARPDTRWVCETCERGQWQLAALTK